MKCPATSAKPVAAGSLPAVAGGIGLWVLDGVNDPPERWQVLRSSLGNKRN